MGTFAGHIVPGLALTLLGLWHTINTISAFCNKGCANFTVKLKHLELIFILSFSVFAIFMQLLDFPFPRFSFKLDSFEHASMFLHLAIFAGFTLSAEISQSSDILSGVSGILAAFVFGQELFLLHFHSTDHVGLEGHYHWLLQLVVFFSKKFPAALVLSISVVFQGCWFMNMGFMLWFPDFASIDDMHAAVTCGSLAAELRAMALANLQFSWILAGILLFTGCVCLKLAGKCTPRNQSTEYEQLHNRGVPVAIDGFKQADP
ncbi:transmembrane protein [Salix suchowensis]|nr:transmembrane protein [Salix suchowensis]